MVPKQCKAVTGRQGIGERRYPNEKDMDLHRVCPGPGGFER